jgi:hypothetical protein
MREGGHRRGSYWVDRLQRYVEHELELRERAGGPGVVRQQKETAPVRQKAVMHGMACEAGK